MREGQANWQLNVSASANYTVAVRYSQDGPNRPLALLIDGVQKAIINFTPTSNWNTWSVATAVINIPAGSHSLSLKTTGASGPNVDKVDISSVEQNTAGEPTLYFVHNDHLTTPQVVTNQSQLVVWVADDEPFGKAKLGVLNSINLDSRFPGQYFDRETNLYYNYFRDYDPSIGRYIESDPIGLDGGINTYAYVEGNPLKGIDPTGLIAVHGNWCGPNWTGGHKYPYSPHPDGYYEKPTDGLDTACQVHDVCYYECRTTNPCDKGARSACFLKCDVNLSTIAKADNSFAGSLVTKVMDRPEPRDPEKNPSGCGCDEPTLSPWPTYDQMMKK